MAQIGEQTEYVQFGEEEMKENVVGCLPHSGPPEVWDAFVIFGLQSHCAQFIGNSSVLLRASVKDTRAACGCTTSQFLTCCMRARSYYMARKNFTRTTACVISLLS